MRFSERKGYKEVSKAIQAEDMNEALRNSLWNVFYANVSEELKNHDLYKLYWGSYLKKRMDVLHHSVFNEAKTIILSATWFEVYDFLEFILNFLKNEEFNQKINLVLEGELSAYRFVNSVITDITNKQEIEMLEEALTDEDFPNVRAHLQRALELLSDKKNPDYRNSIKESISAVESIAKEISKKPNASLGDAIKEIEKDSELHGALKKGFLSLYGYTSDANGIRHSLMEESNLTANDAKFFLLVCTSFINYLKTKM